jgi:hypothetical protein
MDSSLSNLIEGFRLSCQTDGKSPRTVEWYIANLKGCRDFLTSKGLPHDVGEINVAHLRPFVRYLQSEARNAQRNTSLCSQ